MLISGAADEIHPGRHLGTLMAAGLSVGQAVASLLKQPMSAGNRRLLESVQPLLEQGATFSEAFSRSGLFSRHEMEILRAAELGGQLPVTLNTLARQHEQAWRRVGRLRTRFWLPALVLIVAVMAGSLLDLVRGTPGFGYLLLGRMSVLAGICMLSRLLTGAMAMDGLGWAELYGRLGLTRILPACRRHFEFYWYNVFLQLVDAGLDYRSALNGMQTLLPGADYRSRMRTALRYLDKGRSLSDTLMDSGLLLTAELNMVLKVGEKSGRLGAAIRQHLDFEQRRMQVLLAGIDEWLPRAYYGLVVLVALALL